MTTISEHIQQLADEGCEVTIKVTRKASFVRIDIKGGKECYKGSGGSLTKAVERAIDAKNSKKNAKTKREKREYLENDDANVAQW